MGEIPDSHYAENGLNRDQQIAALYLVIGVPLCLSLLGSPIGLILVWRAVKRWDRGEQQIDLS